MRTIKTTPIKSLKSSLTRILNKGVMNQNLRDAITATIEALDNKNIKLAYQLTACKSFVCGEIDPKDKKHAFQEDADANKKALKEDIYCLLDGIHFSLAMIAEQMPSGMMCMSAGGNVEPTSIHPVPSKVTEMKHEGTHPIVQLMIAEQKALYASN